MTIAPYENTINHLEEEIGRYLPTRAARISAERQLKDAKLYAPTDGVIGEKQQVAMQETERRVRELRKQEEITRTDIDARLDATRKFIGYPGIGMDHLNGGLSPDARLVLTALTATALGLGSDAMGELGMMFYSGLSTLDLMTLLDAHSIADRLKARRLLLDLCGKGFVTLDYRAKQVSPEDFNTVEVSLSRRAFCVILEDPSLETEGIFTDADGKE